MDITSATSNKSVPHNNKFKIKTSIKPAGIKGEHFLY